VKSTKVSSTSNSKQVEQIVQPFESNGASRSTFIIISGCAGAAAAVLLGFAGVASMQRRRRLNESMNHLPQKDFTESERDDEFIEEDVDLALKSDLNSEHAGGKSVPKGITGPDEKGSDSQSLPSVESLSSVSYANMDADSYASIKSYETFNPGNMGLNFSTQPGPEIHPDDRSEAVSAALSTPLSAGDTLSFMHANQSPGRSFDSPRVSTIYNASAIGNAMSSPASTNPRHLTPSRKTKFLPQSADTNRGGSIRSDPVNSPTPTFDRLYDTETPRSPMRANFSSNLQIKNILDEGTEPSDEEEEELDATKLPTIS